MEARIKIGEVEQDVAATQRSLTQLDADLANGAIADSQAMLPLDVRVGETARRVAAVRRRLADAEAVVSPYDGRVVELKHDADELVLLVACGLQGLLTLLRQRALVRAEVGLSLQGSAQFIWHVLRLPVDFFAQRYAAEIASRVGAADRVAALLSAELAATLLSLACIAFYACVMLQYDIVLTSLVVLFAAVNQRAQIEILQVLYVIEYADALRPFEAKQEAQESGFSAALRRQIGVVLQTGRFMPGSIGENILGVTGGAIEDAWQAARLAGLAEDIEQMPRGMRLRPLGRPDTAPADRARFGRETTHPDAGRSNQCHGQPHTSHRDRKPASHDADPYCGCPPAEYHCEGRLYLCAG